MYDDKTFKLSNENSGFFGSSSNFYYGDYCFNENSLRLAITKASHYSYTVVDDEPSEGDYPFQEKINPEIDAEGSIQFIFPASGGEWKIRMVKII